MNRPQEPNSRQPAHRPNKRAALIGVGGYGRVHLDVIRRLRDRGEVELVAVADPFKERFPELASRLRGEGVAWHRDHHELLADTGPLDLVVIAAPIPLHEQMTLDVLEGAPGARILLEKPAVPSVGQLNRLMAADDTKRVRVGFQTLHLPQVGRMRKWIQDGELGRISRVTVAAGWPRNDDYYERAPWAGRMFCDGRLVFDGPATNALSHVLNNVCHVLTGGSDGTSGRATLVTGWLGRVRRMESYDTFHSVCRIAGTEVRTFLTHAVATEVPWVIKVRGEKATAMLRQREPFLWRSDLGDAGLPTGRDPHDTLYSAMLGPEVGFTALPGTLESVIGYTEWTEAVRLAGPIRDIDAACCFRTADGVVAVAGMEARLAAFLVNGKCPDFQPAEHAESQCRPRDRTDQPCSLLNP